MSALLDHLKMQNKRMAFALLMQTGQTGAAMRMLDGHLAERLDEQAGTDRLLADVLDERERYDQQNVSDPWDCPL